MSRIDNQKRLNIAIYMSMIQREKKADTFILWEKKSQNVEILFYRKCRDFEIWVEFHPGQNSEAVNFPHITEYSQE